MRLLLRLIGVASAVLGVAMLTPAVVLLNQQLRVFRLPWGVFDIKLNGTRLGNTAAVCVLGVTGISLLLLAVVSIRFPRRVAEK